MRSLPSYAELHCRSNFSFLTGASHPAELVERAAALGYSAIALTDECTLAGVVRAHVAAREAGIRLIVGSEIRLTEPVAGAMPATDPEASAALPASGPRQPKPIGAAEIERMKPHARLVLLATSIRGYANLSQWIGIARRRAEKGSYLAFPGDVEGQLGTALSLAGLPECYALLVPRSSDSFQTLHAHALWVKRWFGDRGRIAIPLLRRAGDEELVHLVRSVAQFCGLPIVATGDVLMHLRSRKPLQDVLTATRLKLPVAECGRRLRSNAEQHLRSRARIATLYDAEWLANGIEVADACRFSMTELEYQYPREVVPDGTTPIAHLRRLAHEGLMRRFPDKDVLRWLHRIEHELALIEQLRYEAYFLTVADIVRWAREQRILCQGRGSAANSMVCYCLGVTEVNPEEATLLFERFVSAERQEPPDIDVDFEHQRREEVIKYIYAKYGRHRTALTAVVISYRPRSALRDTGRALGMDVQRIETLTKSMHWFDGRDINDERLAQAGLDPAAPLTKLWIELTQQLIGFPRHMSQHPGGFVIARDRIDMLVPVENAAMDGRSIVQWDKDDLDELRLIKVDILALGMLSALRRSIDFIGEKLARPFCMQDIPHGDQATYDMICKADTVGTFQIESRAQMSMLPRLQPRCYYDLVVEVAIVRPGPIQGGMVHPYLRNRHLQEDEIDCPEELKPALARTKGVPIFQEQVMQIAMLAADFTPGEADALRRSMAAWKRRGGLGKYHARLVGRMVEKGYDQAFAEGIFKQIEGFGEYGFPESHAAGFAQLAYASCWIKQHHPDAFLAGLLNSQPMGFYAPAQLVRDARAHGVEVLPVDVTCSEAQSSLEAWAARVARRTLTPTLSRRRERELETPRPHSLSRSRESGPETPRPRSLSRSRERGPETPRPHSLSRSREKGLETPRLRSLSRVRERVRVRVARVTPLAQEPFVVDRNEDSPDAPPPPYGSLSRPRERAGVRVMANRLPVRLGFDRVGGLSAEAAKRIVAARSEAPFASAEDLARRAALNAHDLQALAQADALKSLTGHRHQAAWSVAGIDTRPTPMLRATRVDEPPVTLPAPEEAEETLADYRALGLTLQRHPLALLREQLAAFRVQPAAVLKGYPDGRLARASGLVTHRQRPETAKGAMFITLEDDTGTVNAIVWPKIVAEQRRPLLGAQLLTLYGRWQRQEMRGGEGVSAVPVMHLVVMKAVDHTALLGGLQSRSRDFR